MLDIEDWRTEELNLERTSINTIIKTTTANKQVLTQ